MKVGDMVKYKNLHGHVEFGKFISKSWTGIIIETGMYTGNHNLIVLWSHGAWNLETKDSLQVINESR
jgi:hypothetical protein